jgi:hypothetical protein
VGSCRGEPLRRSRPRYPLARCAAPRAACETGGPTSPARRKGPPRHPTGSRRRRSCMVRPSGRAATTPGRRRRRPRSATRN